MKNLNPIIFNCVASLLQEKAYAETMKLAKDREEDLADLPVGKDEATGKVCTF